MKLMQASADVKTKKKKKRISHSNLSLRKNKFKKRLKPNTQLCHLKIIEAMKSLKKAWSL
jgi:hypothetical protein